MSELFNEWQVAKYKAAQYKDEEARLRRELVDELAGVDRPLADARYKFDDVEGNKVTVITKLNRKLDLKLLGPIWSELTPAEVACVDMKPTLNAKLKKLPDDNQLAQAVIVTDAMPTIEVTPIPCQ